MPVFTIGNYLATRLEQIGLKHYFMVPGDYNLVLLDQLLAAAVDRASALLSGAKKPLLLAGVNLRSYGAIDAFRELAEALGCAVAVMPQLTSAAGCAR